jgi:hypothetical protein
MTNSSSQLYNESLGWFSARFRKITFSDIWKMGMHLIGVLYWETANFFLDTVPLISIMLFPLSPTVVSTDQLIISASMKVHPQVLHTYNTYADIIRIRVGWAARFRFRSEKSLCLEAKKGDFLTCFTSRRNSKI